jgi:hypothetical protein
MPEISGRFAQLGYIAASGAVTLLATFISTKDLRIVVLQRLSDLRTSSSCAKLWTPQRRGES